MTGTWQGEHDDAGEPEGQGGQASGQAAAARPPLPRPVDETSGPLTIIPGPAAQDSPAWQPAASPVPARYEDSRPAAYQGGAATSISSFMSEVQRNGRWTVPAVLTVNQGMSDVQLDLREAIITAPVVELRLNAAMASLKVIVPPGVEVEWAGGFSMMSEEKADPPGTPDPSMWRLRIQHYGLMNSVRVQTLAVGEQPPKWWKRKK